jgi:hypothetical protein
MNYKIKKVLITNNAITATSRRTIRVTKTSTTLSRSLASSYIFHSSSCLPTLALKTSLLILKTILFLLLLRSQVETMTVRSSSATTLFSSRHFPQQTRTCAVVGVGVLGTSLCKQILSSPHLQNVVVTGITKSYDRHELIREQIGFTKIASRLTLTTFEELMEKKARLTKFDYVVFCAPPSGFEDYPAAVQEAIDHLWAGPENDGVFIFTSSGAV